VRNFADEIKLWQSELQFFQIKLLKRDVQYRNKKLCSGDVVDCRFEINFACVVLSYVLVIFVDIVCFWFYLLLFGCCLTSCADLYIVSVPPMIVSEARSEIAYRVHEEVEIPCVASGDPPPTYVSDSQPNALSLKSAIVLCIQGRPVKR